MFISLNTLLSSPKGKIKVWTNYQKIGIDGEKETQFLASAVFLFCDIFILMIIIKLNSKILS